MGILILLILGAIIGGIAFRTMGSGRGLTTNIIIGVAGAFIGAYIMEHAGYMSISYGFSMYSILVAIVSACILLAVVNLIQR